MSSLSGFPYLLPVLTVLTAVLGAHGHATTNANGTYPCEACSALRCTTNGCLAAGGFLDSFCAKGGYDVHNGICTSDEDASGCCDTPNPWPCTECAEGCQGSCKAVRADGLPKGTELCVEGGSNTFPSSIPQLCRSKQPSNGCCVAPSRLLWSFKVEKGTVTRKVAVSADGTRVWEGSTGGTLYSLNVADGKVKTQTFLGVSLYGLSLSTKHNLVIVGGAGAYFAVHTTNGTIAWQNDAGTGTVQGAPLTTFGGQPSDLVWLGTGTGSIVCVRAVDGTQVWKYDTNQPYIVSSLHDNGKYVFSGTGGANVGLNQGYVYALDAMTGAVGWTYGPRSNDINSSPTLSPDGRTVYIGSDDGVVLALNADTGKVVWTMDAPGGSAVFSSAAVTATHVYDGYVNGGVFSLNAATGTTDWLLPFNGTGGGLKSSPVLNADNSLVYIGGSDFRLHCLAAKDGRNVWSYPLDGKLDAEPVLVPQQNVVIIGSIPGSVYALRTD